MALLKKLYSLFQICCGYGTDGFDTRGYDCLVVPEASNVDGGMIKANRFCGASKGIATFGSQTSQGTITTGIQIDKTVCCEGSGFFPPRIPRVPGNGDVRKSRLLSLSISSPSDALPDHVRLRLHRVRVRVVGLPGRVQARVQVPGLLVLVCTT